MSRATRRYEEMRVGEDTYKVWANPPMDLFLRAANGKGDDQMTTFDEIIVEHSWTDENDVPLPVRKIPVPDLLAFLSAYVDRMKAVPKAS